MKSFDYFSDVYKPNVSNNISQKQHKRQMKELIRKEKCANVEDMLNWLYCETEYAFSNIPEGDLRRLVPSNIEFKFIFKNYNYYIHVTMYKYKNQSDIFGDTLYDSVEYTMPLYNLAGMPPIYKNNFEEVRTCLTAGKFYAHKLPVPDYITPVNQYLGQYRAVYEREPINDSEDALCFSYYVRE